MTMTDIEPATAPATLPPLEGPGWGIVMALYLLGRIPWDLYPLLCRADGYRNVPMGYFEETWQARPRADGHPAYTLFRGGKAAGYVELNERARHWASDDWPLSLRVQRALHLQPLMLAASEWLATHPQPQED